MKVLAISYGKNFFEPGNAERERMIACAKEAGELHVVVFTARNDGFNQTTIGGNFFVYPTNSKNKFSKVFNAISLGKEVIKRSEKVSDWVITAQDPFEAGMVAWRISKATGVPFNIQEHGDFFSTDHWAKESILNRFRAIFGKFILKKADSVRVVSKRIKKTMEGLGVRTDKITILSVRTDIDRFSGAKTDPNCIPNYNPNKKYILSVARFVPQKNLSLLIRAFSKIQPKFSLAHLLVVGRGKEEVNLKLLAKKLLPDNSYTFMNWSNDVPALMATAHVYVLSSNYEGWGRVLIEARAAGIPIVTTDVGCVGEELVNSAACQTVSVNDETSLANAIYMTLQKLEEAKLQATQIREGLRSKTNSDREYAKDWTKILENTRLAKL